MGQRLIDANKLVLRFEYGIQADGLLFVPFRDMQKSVNRAPTVDAVAVTRCRDCKYWGDEAGVNVRTDGVRFARCKVHNLCVNGKKIGWCPTEDDFCSQGERRNDDENR